MPYTRGDYFKVHNTPNRDDAEAREAVNGMVILDTSSLYYLVAERDTERDTWRSYQMKKAHLEEEVSIGVTEPAGTLPEAADEADGASLEAVETAVINDGGITPPEGVTGV